MLKIDKSVFTAEELEQYEALISKATVDTKAAEEEEEDKKPANPPEKKPTEKAEEEEMEKKNDCKKSAEPSPELTAALADLADLKKSFEMKEMTQVAKKYAPLGKKEDELAQTLYDMKKSNEANYNAYIAVLDESLGLVEKSGVFAEIGKSAGGFSSAAGAKGKIEAKANEIMKSDPKMDRATAIAKAWEQSPELMAEYDEEYRR